MKKTISFNLAAKFPLRKICAITLGIFLLMPQMKAEQNLLENSLQDDTKLISGKVVDLLSNEGLPGVSILIKGTSTGTITDVEGNYSINASVGDVLVFSFIGYIDEEEIVDNQDVIDMGLSPSLIDMDEVVVIGYGVQKKKLSTGANLHVGGDEIMQKKTLRLEQALQGLAPGVNITANGGQPGDDLRVSIRGVGTVGNSTPLYVVDGMVTDNIRFLNPTDIESVDILKDAASSAIYGARAANGVILITTKKGEKGELSISFDSYMGIQNAPKKLDMLNASEYLMIQNEQRENMGYAPFYDQELIDTIGEGTDWQDHMFIKNAPMQSHSFSMSGGNETSVFSSSLSYFKQEGIIGPDTISDSRSNYQRVSLRLNSVHKLYNDHVRVGQNLVYSQETQEGVGTSKIYGNNAVRGFLNASPTFDAYNDTMDDGFGRSWIPTIAANDPNPLAALYYSYIGVTKRDKLLGNIYAEVEPIKGLVVTTRLNIDLMNKLENEYKPIYELTPTNVNDQSTAIMRMERNFTYNWENYITYTKSFGDHKVNALIGNTLEEYNRFNVAAEKEDLVIDDFDNAVIDGATNDETDYTGGGKITRRLSSFYSRLNYDYAEKYLFSAIMRLDGSSKFGPDNKFGFFPSVSAGWVVTEENFFNVNGINFLKLRASWGRNGNDKIFDYMYEATIASSERDYYFGADDVQFVGASPEKIHNTKLKWETSEQTNIGIDSRFLDFNLTLDVYEKTTKDWLIIAPVSDLAGTDAPTINGGDVRNRGIELMLGYNHNFGDFIFHATGNLALNQNEVLLIDNPEGVIHGEENQLSHGQSESYRAEVGYPIGYFYGYETDGIFQDEDEINSYTNNEGELIQPYALPGDVKYLDLNEDGILDGDDRTMIGNPHPDLVYGLSFDCSYKGFDFALMLQGVYGNQILYGYRAEERQIANHSADILNRWTGPGTSNDHPRVTTGAEGNSNYKRVSDMVHIKEGAYMKVRGLTLGYNFSEGIMENVDFLSQFRIYVSAQNLFTISKYPGYDPEVGSGDLDATRYENYSIGIDNGYYPTPRTFLVGLNLKF